jgi:uncharacterized integral membrane protein (TIGR00698 family)
MLRAVLLERFAHARQVMPGVLLAAILAGLAKELTEGAPISPILVAVAFGVLWRNVIGVHEASERGLQWVMQVLLRVGIALVGFRLTLTAAADVAIAAAPVVISCVLVALAAGALLARARVVSRGVSQLLAVGTAVCGCTAVAALSPAIRAKPEETACAIVCVVVFGSLGMLCYPWLAAQLFAESPMHAGIFLGTAIHDTSQVIGAGLIYSQQAEAPAALAAASATKLIRNLALAVLIPLATWRHSVHGVSGAAVCRAAVLPGFVIWFLLFVAVRTAGDAVFVGVAPPAWWSALISSGQALSDACLTCGMTAVGLSLSFTQIRKISWRDLAAGLLLAAVVAACSLGVTLALPS